MIPPFSPHDGWPAGPRRLVLLGPPGCGKTYAILETFILPALRGGVSSREVLAVSFTKAAATEIASRLARELGGEVEEYKRTSSTIHSEAYRLVRQFRDPNVRDEEPRDKIQPDELDEDGAPPERSKGIRRAMRAAWDYARNTMARGQTRGDQIAAVWDRFAGEIAFRDVELDQVIADCESYEASKEERGEIDFTDMLLLALERGEVPARELLVVDEAQDCSPLQWALIEAWSRAARRVLLVGDPDQAVHNWAGSDVRPLIARLGDPRWGARRLAQSYRVPRVAHRLARALILRDQDRVDAPYEPTPRDGQALELEPDGAVEAIEEASRAGRKVLVLARSKKLLARLGDALIERGTPYRAERGYSPLTAPIAVSVTRALLALRLEGRARIRDARLLLRELPAAGHFPSKRKGKVMSEVVEWPEDAFLEVPTLEAMGVDVRDLLEGSVAAGLGVLLSPGTARKKKGKPTPSRDRGREIARIVENRGLGALDDELVVTLTSMHASKGREAELVVVDLEVPKPVALTIREGDESDERRLLYVALTRTQDVLVLVRPSEARMDMGHLLGLATTSPGGLGTSTA